VWPRKLLLIQIEDTLRSTADRGGQKREKQNQGREDQQRNVRGVDDYHLIDVEQSAGRELQDSLGAAAILARMRLFAALLIVGAGALAQTHHHAPEAETGLDLAKLPKPVVLDGIGHSHILITTKSPEAQRWFDQGLALLHCFWDYEALRAFEEAATLDPDCAMCHWGLARAVNMRGGNKELEKSELAKAKELSPKASEREQRYIRADAESEDKNGDEAERAYAKEMEALIVRYPEDIEARLLYALSLNHGYDEKGDPRLGTVYGQESLRELLREHPDNAAANHYWIHAVEGGEHPEWALESARRLGALAPTSGHMVHMPGHIFFRMGDYEQARQVFLSSMRVDSDYMARQHVSTRNDWNYAHNISYLIADCAEEGRYQEAREHARTLAGLADDPDRTGAASFYVFQIGSTAARLAVRYARWDDVIEHPLSFGVPDDSLSIWARGYRDGLLAYARGMKAAEADQPAVAETQSNVLDALLWRLSQEDVGDKSKGPRDRVLKLLGTASVELRGYIAGQKGEFEKSRTLLEHADEQEKKLGYSEPPQYSRPALEVLGAVCIRASKFEEARAAFSKALAERRKPEKHIANSWRLGRMRTGICLRSRPLRSIWPIRDNTAP
jgi:tetratricopeptide (TPR) repeat protein